VTMICSIVPASFSRTMDMLVSIRLTSITRLAMTRDIIVAALEVGVEPGAGCRSTLPTGSVCPPGAAPVQHELVVIGAAMTRRSSLQTGGVGVRTSTMSWAAAGRAFKSLRNRIDLQIAAASLASINRGPAHPGKRHDVEIGRTVNGRPEHGWRVFDRGQGSRGGRGARRG